MSRGEISTGRKRNSHPLDWCVDESWVAWQLYEALGGFWREMEAGEAIWDPSIGSGRTMVTFAENDFDVIGSDVVKRLEPEHFPDGKVPRFLSLDFRDVKDPPQPCSIVGNFPYSYVEGIGEAFVRQALKLTSRRVCALFPIKWRCSQGRYDLFREFPPQAILNLTQRPSMPPGDMINAMGRKAFKGGTVDYAWYVWNVREPTRPNETRECWLPPLDRPEMLLPIEGLA